MKIFNNSFKIIIFFGISTRSTNRYRDKHYLADRKGRMVLSVRRR